MGKASSAKKVARAATTGGGRTSRGDRPWGWYAVMAFVAVLGVALVVLSRNERLQADNPETAERPRPPGKGFEGDHWHAAYGVYLCDKFAGDIQSERDPNGIHTHNDGVIHIHPFTSAASGSKATLGAFAQTVGMTLTSNRVKLPGGEEYSNGDKCGDKAGRLRVLLNGQERSGDPKDIRLRDRDQIVIAFAPEDAKVPSTPPSAPNLDNLNDVPGSPGATSSTTQAPNPDGTPNPSPGEPGTSGAAEPGTPEGAPMPEAPPESAPPPPEGEPTPEAPPDSAPPPPGP